LRVKQRTSTAGWSVVSVNWMGILVPHVPN